MTALQHYLRRTGQRDADFAAQVGVHRVTLNRIKRGERKADAQLAHRIEAATAGEVRAADLTGEAGREVLNQASGRWLVRLDADGSLHLPAEALEAIEARPGQRVVLRLQDGLLQVNTSKWAIEQTRAALAELPERDLVAELIAERRAEANG